MRVGFIGAGRMAQAIAKGFTSKRSSASTCHKSNREVVEHSDILVLSVKPQVMDSVLAEMSDLVDPFKLGGPWPQGVTLDHLQSRLLPDSRAAKPEDGPLIEALFKSVGTCDYLPENLMDAATGLSGSGPAFILEAIDAMSKRWPHGACANCSPLALRLAAQTVYGTSRLVLESGRHPAELRDAITSRAAPPLPAYRSWRLAASGPHCGRRC
uniref:Pyrroline-5-carboxylate reductase n=1 Tax=Macrostomum lignano TaxID=282301 RepID=A0A1I8FQZ3_9PLAT